jgi:hypothetical protein
MSGLLKHVKVSAVADDADATKVQPSNWNDYHVYSGGNNGSILLRDTSDVTYGGSWLQSVAVGQVLVSAGVGSLPAYSATPTVTSLTAPTLIGGTGTTQTLTLKPTTGVGATGADIVFAVGNNGATEALRILNSGAVRFPNNVYFAGRNAANSADVNMFKVNASDQIDVGAVMNTAAVNVGGALTTTGANSITSSGSVSAAAAGYLNWTGRARTYSPLDGVIVLGNNADTGFTRLNFGGTSSSFPALTRNAAVLETKLADNSAYASHAALLFQTMTALIALGGGAAPTLGTIGGSGPATAAQNTWLKMTDSTGAACYVPVWK